MSEQSYKIRQEFQDKMQAVAVCLGTEWSAKDNYRESTQDHASTGALLIHKKGPELFGRVDDYAASPKIEFMLCWPKDDTDALKYPKPEAWEGSSMTARHWGVTSYDTPPAKANISLSRTPQAIATDLQRRLVDDYLPLYDEAVRKRNERRAASEERVKLAERLAKLVPDPDGINPQNGYPSFDNSFRAPCRIEGQLDSEHLNLTLRIPTKDAERVLKAIIKAGEFGEPA